MLKKITPKQYAAASVFLVSIAALGSTGIVSEAPSVLFDLLSVAAQNEIAQAGFFFTMASWIHSGRVKKEIKNSFDGLTLAINKVADTLREDLKRHGDKLDSTIVRVEKLESKTNK